jgi:hypothetical protein
LLDLPDHLVHLLARRIRLGTRILQLLRFQV